jgi:hypothetical protein
MQNLSSFRSKFWSGCRERRTLSPLISCTVLPTVHRSNFDSVCFGGWFQQPRAKKYASLPQDYSGVLLESVKSFLEAFKSSKRRKQERHCRGRVFPRRVFRRAELAQTGQGSPFSTPCSHFGRRAEILHGNSQMNELFIDIISKYAEIRTERPQTWEWLSRLIQAAARI